VELLQEFDKAQMRLMILLGPGAQPAGLPCEVPTVLPSEVKTPHEDKTQPPPPGEKLHPPGIVIPKPGK
jgi:hypothetical protein